jgi:formylglycine-generating enzyme required for sulfatase activity
MIVVPAGRFLMGSPAGQGRIHERPQHEVTIVRSLAVARSSVSFDEWDACAARGGCRSDVSDEGWGRGRRPTMNVSWADAQAYAKWLSDITGKTYRLLSEAEWEYVARAGSPMKYPWGDEIKLDGKLMASCADCGSECGENQTAPVGSFPANAFGLHDMICNVNEWTQDCWNESYRGAPTDGSAWTSGDCIRRVVRGGSWGNGPDILSSAMRGRVVAGLQVNILGFRVARTLNP